jgi:DNA-binding MarR family transcriptional regulator
VERGLEVIGFHADPDEELLVPDERGQRRYLDLTARGVVPQDTAGTVARTAYWSRPRTTTWWPRSGRESGQLARQPRNVGEPNGDTPDLGELLGRELSTAVVMFHEAAAARRGLTATENKALDLLARRGPITSGELARELGLTPGAVTGLVDRLAQAGYAQRVPDVADRRKIFVVADVDRLTAEMKPIFEPLREAVANLAHGYTPDQMTVIEHFVSNAAAILRDQTARLTGEAQA